MRSSPSFARTAAARLASRQRVVDLVEVAGLHTAADRLDLRRSGGDIAAVLLPAAPGAWSRRRVKAFRLAGKDQCVEAFHQGGWWGYERPLPDLLLGWVRAHPGPVLDVGANTGLYSLFAASTAGVTVHAFEAFPPVAQMLRHNLGLNSVPGQVVVVPAAVTDSVGTVDLHVPAPTDGSVETSCSVEESFKGGGGTVLTVPATTLDAWWAEQGRPAVTTIKVDVEGAEHRVLAGGLQLLTTARPVVFCEVLPGAELAELERVRALAGYVDVRLSQWEAVVGDEIRFHELAWNHALVPTERVGQLLDVVKAAGLLITRLD